MANGLKKWPIFICYRQDDGKDTAERLFKLLRDQPITLPEDSDGKSESRILDVYFDQTTPGVGNWTAYHEPFLQRSRALIVVCSPGAKSRLGDDDWVHREIGWWLGNRETAPVLVDPIGKHGKWVPNVIADRWPNAQRIKLVEEEWKGLRGAKLRNAEERSRARLLGGIVPSGRNIYQEELEEEKERTQQLEKTSKSLRLSLFGAVALLVLAIVAAGYAVVQQGRAEDLIRRVNVGQSEPGGQRAMKKICLEAIDVTLKLTMAFDNSAGSRLEARFRELYWGSMNLVEIRQKIKENKKLSTIESAMVLFGRGLDAKAGNYAQPSRREALCPLANAVRKECIKYLQIPAPDLCRDE